MSFPRKSYRWRLTRLLLELRQCVVQLFLRSRTPSEPLKEKKPQKKNFNGTSTSNKSSTKKKEKFKVADKKRKMANNKEGPPIWHNIGDPTQRVFAEKWKTDFAGDHVF